MQSYASLFYFTVYPIWIERNNTRTSVERLNAIYITISAMQSYASLFYFTVYPIWIERNNTRTSVERLNAIYITISAKPMIGKIMKCIRWWYQIKSKYICLSWKKQPFWVWTLPIKTGERRWKQYSKGPSQKRDGGEKHIFPLPQFQTVLGRTEFGQAKPESPNISTPKRESRSDKDIPFP
jgi:hypothetical protein